MKEQIRKYDPNEEYFIEEQCYINELSNISEDNEVSIAQARVPPGVTTHWHRLNGIVERYVIIQGKVKLKLAIFFLKTLAPVI
jgi:hypothetical protein